VKKPSVARFQKAVLLWYAKEGRHALPWRKTRAPYKILVSEVMLQQTQVDRVIPKYVAFLEAFPNVAALAAASVAEVLKLWSGLGYNRRALFLKRAAEAVVAEHGGKFPKDAESLEKLPGVGSYTARAVATFAYNAPHAFIETNIRAVFLHAFFPEQSNVSDTELMPLIEKAMPKDGRNREWYSALMDYGSHIKKHFPNPSRKSKHHQTQSKFAGSLRQARGAILKACTEKPRVKKSDLLALHEKSEQALAGLIADGFVIQRADYVSIKK
jgi:A/G-specific adenine glycosylase